MADIIQIRRDTAANWTSANPTLAQGELGVETDTDKIKIGDGSTAWTSLSYIIDTGSYLLDSNNLSDISNSATALTNLGLTATATEINYTDGVTSAIQTQLNAKQATITGGATTITSSNLTTSRALVSDGSGKVAVSAVTSTEVGYLDGVTSAIQTQLNAKAPLASPTFTGTVTIPAATVTGNMLFGDNDVAAFGGGSDLQILHDGTNSFINDVGTGNLNIATNGAGIYLNKGTSENMAVFTPDGAVTLYHNNAAKIATTATGISVTGTVAATTITGSLSGSTVDGTNEVGFRNVPPVGTKTSSYTLAVGDVGKYVQVGSGGSITIPNGVFSEGDAISIFNNTTGSITITCSITTAYIAGVNTDKSSMTLLTRGVATILFISGTLCVVSGSVA